MTGQEIQDKLDGIVADLQTVGKGMTVQIGLRGSGNDLTEYPLSSDANGVINDSQLDPLQDAVDVIKPIADTYYAEFAVVKGFSDAFSDARAVHQVLIDAAASARSDLNDALEADAAYQTAKTNLDNARADVDYINARNAYKSENVSENYGNISEAKGKYVV